jgi:dihydrolipoamide dehydrogenase
VTGVDSSGAALEPVEPARRRAETIGSVVLVAADACPTEGLGLDEAGVKKDNRGRVIVDAHYANGVKGIAIGDVSPARCWHKAEDEARRWKSSSARPDMN